jgi:hypothetical protein
MKRGFNKSEAKQKRKEYVSVGGLEGEGEN